jgi:hypothetical protein
MFCGGVSWTEDKAEIAGRTGLSDIKTVLRCSQFLQVRYSRGDIQSPVPDKTALRGLFPAGMDDFQLQFEFG